MTPEEAANKARMQADIDGQWINNMDTQRAINQTVRNNQNAMSSQRTFYESEIARLSGIIERTEMTVTLEVGRVLSEKFLVERDLDLANSDKAMAERDLALAKRDLLDYEYKLDVLNTEVSLVEANNSYLRDEKQDLEVDKSLLEYIQIETAGQVRDTNRLMTVAKMSSYVYASQMDDLVDALKAEVDAGEPLSHDSIDRAKQKVQQASEAALTPLVAVIEKKLRVRKNLTPEGEVFMEKVNAHPLAVNMNAMMDRLKDDLFSLSIKKVDERKALMTERGLQSAEKKRIRDEKTRERNERMSALKLGAGL
jgi:hypothetical protein